LSKGEIKLKSTNPYDHPEIDPNSLSDEKDLVDFVQAFKNTREVFNQPALDDFNGGEYLPGNGPNKFFIISFATNNIWIKALNLGRTSKRQKLKYYKLNFC